MLHLHALITHPPGSHLTSDPPLHLLTRLIPQANIAYCEKPWGTVLLQELVINGITIGKYSFDLNEHCEISINFSKPLAVLQYTTNGFNESDSNIAGFPFLNLQYGIYYLPPGQSVGLHFPVGSYNFLQIHFSLSLVRKFTLDQPAFTHFHQPDDAVGALCSTVLPIDKRTNAMLASLNHHLMLTPLNAYYVNDRCLFLLMRFISEHNHFQSQQKRLFSKDQQFPNLEEAIRDHFNNRTGKTITTKTLAHKMNLSVYQLNKLTLVLYDLSASSLITKIRMDIAVSFLGYSSLSISEICARVGYNDVSSFSRAFKKRFGLPPSQFSAKKE